MAIESIRYSLIKSMRSLLRRMPFSAISVSDICNAAHIGRRTFYRYFPDKYSLLNATYEECFFAKIRVEEDALFWDIFEEICKQIYEEKEFFSHAFAVTGQNGFWDETRNLLFPYMKRDYPSTEITDEMCDFFVENDINMLFHLLLEWIEGGLKKSPEDFSFFIRSSFAVYGKWVYEVATGKPRSEYTMKKYKEKKW